MTALTANGTFAAPRPTTPFGRITRVTRLIVANPWTTILMPGIILGVIFAANLIIWALIFSVTTGQDAADARDGLQYSGASSWIFVYMTIIAIQAMNLTFPLALGFGATRRDFYLGSALTFVLLSVFWTLVLTIMGILERVTDGWGLGGRMFSAIYFAGDGPWWQSTIVFFFGLLFFFFAGSAFGSVYVRWKGTGLVFAFVILGALVLGAIVLLTVTDAWGAVGDFFTVNQAIGTALWLMVPTAIFGVTGYFILRGATPRS